MGNEILGGSGSGAAFVAGSKQTTLNKVAREKRERDKEIAKAAAEVKTNEKLDARPKAAGTTTPMPANETIDGFMDRMYGDSAPSDVADKAKKDANPAQANPIYDNPIYANPTSANPLANKLTEQKPLFMQGEIMPSLGAAESFFNELGALSGEGVTPTTPEPTTPEPTTPKPTTPEPATPEPTGAKSKEEAEANARFADEFGTNLEAMRVKEDEKYEVGMGGFKPATRVNQAASAPILRQARRERKKGNIAVADKLAYEGARMRADEPSIDTEELRAQRAAQKRDTGRAAREQDELAKKTKKAQDNAEEISRLDEDDAAHRAKVERDAVKAEEENEEQFRRTAAAVKKIADSRKNKNA